jgi:hypothetical protein
MIMTRVSRSKVILTATTLVALSLFATACASKPKPIPTWGGTTSSAPTGTPYVYRAPVVVSQTQESSFNANGRRTFTQGCTGSFSVRDARTNREISNGRAFNSGSGLIALDTRGRQTRAISSSTNQSVVFLPDCNCRAGGNQSSDLPSTHQFAATAPSAASCSAG